MNFLVDENLPRDMAGVFREIGFVAACVLDDDGLRGKSDEVVFEQAAARRSALVTRDVGFADRMAFVRPRPLGLVLLRYPSQLPMRDLVRNVRVAIGGMTAADFTDMIVILEPGLTRIRKIS